MKKNIFTLVIFTLATLGLIVMALLQAPYYLMRKSNEICIHAAGGVNRFYFPELADHTFNAFPSPCPDLLYSNLVFDLSKAALMVEFPAYNDFWVCQMVGDNTDTFAYVGYRNEKNRPIKMVLFSPYSPGFEAPEDAMLIKSPFDTGVLLVRYLVRDRNELPAIDAVRHSVKLLELETE